MLAMHLVLSAVVVVFKLLLPSQGIVSIGEPLEAIAGNNLQILCTVRTCPCAGDFNLRQKLPGSRNYIDIKDERISRQDYNGTVTIFTLSNTVPEDNGKTFSCSIDELHSEARVTIYFLEIQNVQSGILIAEDSIEESLILRYDNPTNSSLTMNIVRIDDALDLDILFSNQTLIRFVPRKSDSGIYMIIISNSFYTHDATFTLDVQFAPVINLVYKNLDCSEENNICSAAFGVNVEIQFQFTSNPAGTISLSFPSTSNSRVIDSTMIVITNINPLNAGEYRAVVTNAVKGITRANSVSVELTVGMALIEGSGYQDGDLTSSDTTTIRMLPIAMTVLVTLLFSKTLI